ncbi:vitamin B12 dependent-methionine synthase activation domain-containing protein [Segatella bryantii]|uniref:5-methyltetrahydrofolate--homocysteine methyltransferase n=1 Tax=Segatella bryantii TaxID=77095 RepID=A0ABX4EJ56_SEGBR|nr:vitamin B12 dependent-methionine synthase activation domain-containing protein [Segatella bryantii]OYP56332.1 5-methyltetrahydrofolate--homocysteine methyltransferase [Segatella bryantii]UKK80367.1 5-methyltetrahydrofolate--homocysteine methyltransferase [Segatella bryantii]
MKLEYNISDIVPYINWIYFFHAWNLTGKPQTEKDKLQADAERILASWEGHYHTYAIFELLPANSDGDDLIVGGERIPMLRQQRPQRKGEPNLCLADFVYPLSMGKKDVVGLFCTTVSLELQKGNDDDAYLKMMHQVLCDRLAEGTAEKMHEEVRRHYWGYAPDEQLTMQQTHNEEYQGIRPAIGYPSLPDTSVNFILDKLLDMKQVGIRLTENGMMTPHASVSGFMFAHPLSRYFDLGKIGEDQLRDYAHRRGLPVELVRKFLQASLLKR